MPANFGLSASALQRKAAERSSGFFGLVQDFEAQIRTILRAEGIEEVTGGNWSDTLNQLPYERKQRLSELLLRSTMDISDVDLREAIQFGGGAFVERRPSATFTHGFGNLAMGEGLAGSTEEIFTKLFYTGSTVQVRGVGEGMSFGMTPRYKADYLWQQSEVISDIAQGKIFDNSRMFVLDTETAGFSMRSGIWEIAGRSAQVPDDPRPSKGQGRKARRARRLAKGQGEAAEFVAEAVIDNDNMRKGMVLGMVNGEQTPMDLFQKVQDGRPVDRTIVEAIDRMGDEILGSSYVMGHNLSFDMPRISHDIREALKGGGFDQSTVKRMDQILDHLENKVKMIDTQVLSQYIYQGTGEDAIKVAAELMSDKKFTPHSIANQLLQTNVLDEIVKSGAISWDELTRELSGQGTHSAAFDTFLTQRLGELQMQHIRSVAQGGPAILRPLTEQEIRSSQTLTSAVRKKIASSAAMTPYTRMQIGDDFMRPMEYMVEHMRQTQAPIGPLNRAEVFFNAGQMSDWAESMLTPEGFLKDSARLYDEDLVPAGRIGKSLRKRMLSEGLQVGKLSPFEALLSTKIAEVSYAPPGFGSVHRLASDVIGGGTAKATVGIKRHGRNIAMSPEILRWAEDAGVITPGAVSGEFIDARWSTVRGKEAKGLALVADVFDRAESTGPDQIRRFKTEFAAMAETLSDEEFHSRFHMTKGQATKAIGALDQNAIEFGVQIGFIDGTSNPEMDRLLNLLESEGFNLDNVDAQQLRTHAYFLGDDTKKVHTGLSYMDTPNTVADEILDIQRGTRQVQRLAYEELAKDPVKRLAVEIGRRRGRDAARTAFDTIKSPITKRVGIGGLAAMAGYYLYNKKQEQDPYDETSEFSGWETGDLSGRTQYEMSGRPQGILEPLSTAGLVQELDYNKIGHHNMSADRHSHLF